MKKLLFVALIASLSLFTSCGVSVGHTGDSTGTIYGVWALESIPTIYLIDCETGEILVRDAHPDLDSIMSNLLP